MRLVYRSTECTPVQFVSAVAATSGASEEDTFRTLTELMLLLRFPLAMSDERKRLIAADVDRITYGQCKIVLR